MFSPELTTGDDALYTSLMLMFSFLIELTYSSCTTYIVFFMFEFRGDIILVFVSSEFATSTIFILGQSKTFNFHYMFFHMNSENKTSMYL